jgi:hypothetical protein
MFLFFSEKEKEPKRNRPFPAAPSGLPCASPKRPARAETRPPEGELKQSAHPFPAATSMLGAGKRG